MLTKEDLIQIDAIVKRRIAESNENLRKGLRKEIKQTSKQLETRLMRKMNTISNSLDRDIVDHEKRIKRVENHLQLSAN